LQGRLNVILGAAGSGKSSLLSILAGQLSYQPFNKQFSDLTAGRPTSVSTPLSPQAKHGMGSSTLVDDEPEVGVQGSVWYNQKPLRTDYFQREAQLGEVSRTPWERCGFVECVDLFHMDLTVADVVTYAMKVYPCYSIDLCVFHCFDSCLISFFNS
jgi:putative ribosome biogenesis GTPase RsgA